MERKEAIKRFERLQQLNAELRNMIDNCLPIDEAENEDVWKKINELIENELEQESLSNM